MHTLPPELIWMIVERVDLLDCQVIKSLSCVSKKLRAFCLPIMFHNLTFGGEILNGSLEILEQFLETDLYHHVRCLTYICPVLLDHGENSYCIG